ncbi:unnamed protein product (macronuclear) [Paramecium tetraurelia]|uniref:Uncharacterized protein n=1 Tax=Paramecium tetraurelia TaxID=5888 RepID=A0E5W3_PARTE|nr:uncharacterized protein GSPATT00003543001 [Paramecium tetraurelia]CAK90680.1 unnamed protein product [Paramecium tetraurelia]|eukprot:XP_001458077.1 hypothetical protein (macronuclear) [Paramecium tetraurelia strain d4-2]
MSEAQADRILSIANQETVNRLFRVCYKQITGQRPVGKFQDSDHQAVLNCHRRLVEVLKLVAPAIVPLREE